jgi:hypothetical protein
MLTRIALKNFMSHVETTLDLVAGLNVITGPNNCGKSAIVAAIQLVCRNHLTGDVVMRHGAKECAVTLWTDDGHEITWRRKGKDTSYVIDGTEHNRLKGKPPEVLHSILKLPEIEEGEQAFDLHFGLQKEPIFLLDEAGSKAAKFFASSSDAALLMQMQSEHKSRTRDRKSRLKQLGEQAEKWEENLVKLEPLTGIRTETDAVVTQFDQLQQDVQQAERLAEHRRQMIERQTDIATEENILQQLEALPAWPEFHDTDPVEEWLQQYHATHDQLTLYQKRTTVLEPLTVPPELVDVNSLAQHLHSRRQQETFQKRWQAERDRIAELQPPPTLEIDTQLQNTVAHWKPLLAQMQSQETQLKTATDDLAKLRAEMQSYVKTHPTCPVCTQPWKLEHLLAEGHRHA